MRFKQCQQSRNGLHRYRMMKVWPSDRTLMYRACKFCDYVEYSRFDPISLRKTILVVETRKSNDESNKSQTANSDNPTETKH